MPQYHLAASAEADRLEAKAGAASKQVARYIQRADDYTLAVVLFAVSLFFAAISTRMHSPRLRVTLLAMGYVLCAATIVWLATQPVNVPI
jgi:uncharacterized membrane protein